MLYSDFKIKKIAKGDKNYPKDLLMLKDPPKQIYYRGKLTEGLLKKSIAIVGSRRMTRYGASVIDEFISAFVANDITTISGYMYGVDTEVHSKTLEYEGRTVAVIGGGINSPYPPENDKMYTKILQSNGTVLSEYEPESKPKLWMYPQRNRIIAALATLGVLVIEASEKSGSLITVRFAQKLKKKIFAVPGPITSSVSAGANYLIKEGVARMVTEPSDILGEEGVGNQKNNRKVELSGIEKEIFDVLKDEEMNIDEMSATLGKGLVEVSTAVSTMALKGIITEAAGKYYCA